MPDPITTDPKLDGLLQVRGATGLSNSAGEMMATEAQFWLCRCGGSGNKPFCDGTHAKIGFVSARQSDPGRRNTKVYTGEHITVHDNLSICAHVGVCTAHPHHQSRALCRGRWAAVVGRCRAGLRRALHAVPMRPVEEQALLRWCALGGRVQG